MNDHFSYIQRIDVQLQALFAGSKVPDIEKLELIMQEVQIKEKTALHNYSFQGHIQYVFNKSFEASATTLLTYLMDNHFTHIEWKSYPTRLVSEEKPLELYRLFLQQYRHIIDVHDSDDQLFKAACAENKQDVVNFLLHDINMHISEDLSKWLHENHHEIVLQKIANCVQYERLNNTLGSHSKKSIHKI